MPPKVVSKYRNLTGAPWKTKYSELRISAKLTDTWGLASNASYLAFIGDASARGLINIIDIKDQTKRPPELKISAHSGATQELRFSPFDTSTLCSSGDDGSVKVWKIPDKSKWTDAISTPLAALTSHTKRTYAVDWNPSTLGIVASGSCDGIVNIWDTSKDKPLHSITLGDFVHSVNWNIRGSLLATTCKDKKLRVIDPRNNSSPISNEIAAHEGTKASKVVWADGQAGDEQRIVTSGFDKAAGRQLKIWDTRKLSAAVQTCEVDRQSPFLLLHWDESAGILYAAAKGETIIRPFVFTDTGQLQAVAAEYRSAFAFKGLCFSPKRAVNVSEIEIQRAYLSDPNSITPLTFKVLRKDTNTFHEDLYPNCVSDVPALTVEEWISGKTCDPLRVSLNPSGAKNPLDTSAPPLQTITSADKADVAPPGKDAAKPSAPSQVKKPAGLLLGKTQPRRKPMAELSSPKADTPKSPKADTPKSPKADAPKSPKADAPKSPKADTPKSPKAAPTGTPKSPRTAPIDTPKSPGFESPKLIEIPSTDSPSQIRKQTVEPLKSSDVAAIKKEESIVPKIAKKEASTSLTSTAAASASPSLRSSVSLSYTADRLEKLRDILEDLRAITNEADKKLQKRRAEEEEFATAIEQLRRAPVGSAQQ